MLPDVLLSITAVSALLLADENADAPMIAPVDITDTAQTAAITPANTLFLIVPVFFIAYEIKSGLSRTKISHMMDCETWLNAKKAVELAFADSIMFTDNDTDTDDGYEFSQREVSNRLMNQLIKKNTPTAGVKICDLQTRLNLLK